MPNNSNALSYYIFKDLRASQNNNTKEGFQVVRTQTLQDAIAEFRKLPREWTTALGVSVSANSELDLVQRREGEPVLSGDYQRIPTFKYNKDVQAAVRTLLTELNIRWQSDYRIFGTTPVLIPVLPFSDSIRDRAINGKHLLPEAGAGINSAIKEVYTPDKGWCTGKDFFRIADQFGYNNPHVPKLTTIHAQFADEQGQCRTADMSPYNYILMLERTKLLEHDPHATKHLSESVECFLSQMDPSRYIFLFGSEDRLQLTGERTFRRVKDRNAEHLAQHIEKRDLAPLAEPIVSIIEHKQLDNWERSEARELLGRVLSLPEDKDQKMSITLRIRANAALNELYSTSEKSEGQERGCKLPKER